MSNFKRGDRVKALVWARLMENDRLLYREGFTGTVVGHYDASLLVKWDSEESYDDGLWYINEKDVDKVEE